MSFTASVRRSVVNFAVRYVRDFLDGSDFLDTLAVPLEEFIVRERGWFNFLRRCLVADCARPVRCFRVYLPSARGWTRDLPAAAGSIFPHHGQRYIIMLPPRRLPLIRCCSQGHLTAKTRSRGECGSAVVVEHTLVEGALSLSRHAEGPVRDLSF